MRKSFMLEKIPEKAEITVTGLGFYKLFVNGKDITKGILAPYISNSDQTVYYDNYDIKQLLCAGENAYRALFAIPITAIQSLGERITLPRLRPAFPKHCACLFLNLPIYSYRGEHLGNLQEATISSFIATMLYTNKGFTLPISAVSACSDAILLKKEQLYPLGQRIPAPLLPIFTDKSEGLITKPILRSAMEKGALVKLTLSLPPFSLETDTTHRRFFHF
jgi:hypothetical protein